MKIYLYNHTFLSRNIHAIMFIWYKWDLIKTPLQSTSFSNFHTNSRRFESNLEQSTVFQANSLLSKKTVPPWKASPFDIDYQRHSFSCTFFYRRFFPYCLLFNFRPRLHNHPVYKDILTTSEEILQFKELNDAWSLLHQVKKKENSWSKLIEKNKNNRTCCLSSLLQFSFTFVHYFLFIANYFFANQ